MTHEEWLNEGDIVVNEDVFNSLLKESKEFKEYKVRVREAIFNNLKCNCASSEYIPSHGIVIGSTCVFCSLKRKIISDLELEEVR
jgi:hypothetical protein